VRDEWFKGLHTARELGTLVRLWHESGAAAVWLPELRRADESGLPPAELSPPPRDPVLLTALLNSDPAGLLRRRLRASNAEVARAEAMARGPAEPAAPDEVAVRRWLAAVGGAADDLAALFRLRRGSEPAWLKAVTAIRERGDPLTRGELAVTGRDLEALGLSGKRIGETLAALLDRVLEEPAANTRERLLALARETR
jgi:tRNA nucleotidyltransferase (CCA-adding enzyme)